MKRNLWGAILGGIAAGALILGILAAVILAEAGLLHLLGVRYAAFGWLVVYVLLAAVLGLPLELFTNGLARALYRLGKATRRQANLLFIPLDTLCSFFIFWLVDACMDAVTATGLSILVLALLFALLSQPIGKKEKPGGDGGTP